MCCHCSCLLRRQDGITSKIEVNGRHSCRCVTLYVIQNAAQLLSQLTRTVLKVVRRGPPLQGGEGHVGPGERRHVRVLGGAERPVLGDLDLAVPRLDDGGRVGGVVPVEEFTDYRVTILDRNKVRT